MAGPRLTNARGVELLASRRGPFRSDTGKASRNHYTLRKIASGYGRWLGFFSAPASSILPNLQACA